MQFRYWLLSRLLPVMAALVLKLYIGPNDCQRWLSQILHINERHRQRRVPIMEGRSLLTSCLRELNSFLSQTGQYRARVLCLLGVLLHK
jgi:hypothetical protein